MLFQFHWSPSHPGTDPQGIKRLSYEYCSFGRRELRFHGSVWASRWSCIEIPRIKFLIVSGSRDFISHLFLQQQIDGILVTAVEEYPMATTPRQDFTLLKYYSSRSHWPLTSLHYNQLKDRTVHFPLDVLVILRLNLVKSLWANYYCLPRAMHCCGMSSTWPLMVDKLSNLSGSSFVLGCITIHDAPLVTGGPIQNSLYSEVVVNDTTTGRFGQPRNLSRSSAVSRLWTNIQVKD